MSDVEDTEQLCVYVVQLVDERYYCIKEPVGIYFEEVDVGEAIRVDTVWPIQKEYSYG